MKKAMKCMAGILALTLAFAQVAPVSAFAEETTAATEEAQAVYSGDCSAEGSSVTWTYNPTEKTLTFSGTGAIKDYQPILPLSMCKSLALRFHSGLPAR